MKTQKIARQKAIIKRRIFIILCVALLIFAAAIIAFVLKAISGGFRPEEDLPESSAPRRVNSRTHQSPM